MSDGSLSQEEIDALLHGGDSAPAEESAAEDSLSPDEIDTIGEICGCADSQAHGSG
jgi:flagellar motor switch protein FliM